MLKFARIRENKSFIQPSQRPGGLTSRLQMVVWRGRSQTPKKFHWEKMKKMILIHTTRIKKSFQFYIVDFITFANGKIKKYMTVAKRISDSFKRAQPEVASFIRLGDRLSQSKKMKNPILQLMMKE